MVRHMPLRIVSPKDSVTVEEITGSRLKLKSMRECLQDRRQQWFAHLKAMQ